MKKLQKYNLKINNLDYTNVFFIKNIKDYKDYLTILESRFDSAEKEIKNRIEDAKNTHYTPHTSSILTAIAENPCYGYNNPLVNNKILESKVIMDQIKFLDENKYLIINSKGGYFTVSDKDNIEIIKITEKCLYTEDDIKISKWENGVHYYAKVDDIEVIDNFGDIKWNTSNDAYSVAIWFMEKLNKNN